MADWPNLQDAYGSAEAVPSLLADAEHGDKSAWEELWGRLCHQGTVSSASYAALPRLAAMAGRNSAVGYDEALGLAASIISASDRPPGFDNVRESYADELATLTGFAERSLGLTKNFGDFVYALQFLMAFEGVQIWQNHLESLADEEVQVTCPNCSEYLYAALGDPDFKARLAFGPSPSEATPLAPIQPELLKGSEARLFGLAQDRGQDEVAARMLYLFGRATCPNCDHTFLISQALTAENT
ncbi:hypothetical protein [Aeromicrobium sp.]|uniref:hypothetical protein n=1 Tax=Aeromicrobium sp. TaxID=1871063 RepID=UPI002FC86E97